MNFFQPVQSVETLLSILGDGTGVEGSGEVKDKEFGALDNFQGKAVNEVERPSP